jgi:hypothetical protein
VFRKKTRRQWVAKWLKKRARQVYDRRSTAQRLADALMIRR